MPSVDLSLDYHFDTPPDVVFDALTDPKKIREWSGQSAVLEPKVGGRMRLFEWAAGKVARLESGKVLSYTWKVPEWGKSAGESLVTYTLSPDGKGTALTLEHTGLPDEREAANHRQGWLDYVLDPLRDYLKKA